MTLDIWGEPPTAEPSKEINAYNQALADADAELAKYLGPTHKARIEVAKLKKGAT